MGRKMEEARCSMEDEGYKIHDGECRMQDARCRVDGTGHSRKVARWKMNTEQKMQDEDIGVAWEMKNTGHKMHCECHRREDAGRRIQGSNRQSCLPIAAI